MSEKTEGKLVRDKIPEILDEKGLSFSHFVLKEEGYVPELLKKLFEESGELCTAISNEDRENIIEELADIYEVIFAISEALEIHFMLEVFREVFRKREQKGGFDKRIFLRMLSEKDKGLHE